jgi:hypothetical protein
MIKHAQRSSTNSSSSHGLRNGFVGRYRRGQLGLEPQSSRAAASSKCDHGMNDMLLQQRASARERESNRPQAAHSLENLKPDERHSEHNENMPVLRGGEGGGVSQREGLHSISHTGGLVSVSLSLRLDMDTQGTHTISHSCPLVR